MANAYLQRIATAVPENDIHRQFVEFAADMLQDRRARSIFERLAARSDIHHRYSCLHVNRGQGGEATDAWRFYGSGRFPTTAERMKLFEECAPVLARKALNKLAVSDEERQKIRHVLVTCCTGFYAPGLDFDIIDHLGLPDSTERTMVGFMGCYAAINALKLARHIVRSDPDSMALVVNLELCSLHFHETQDLNEVISFLLFSDGCSAALVGGDARGFELESFSATRIENTRELITWRVGNLGFDMFLSGQVPNQIAKAMKEKKAAITGDAPVDLWAIHPGGRAILDAVENGLELAPDDLLASRRVLSCFGNMSSATVMFAMEKLMSEAKSGQRGCAISFGPGMTAETMRFNVV
jgi:predicted naringenin-chalcone synthase